MDKMHFTQSVGAESLPRTVGERRRIAKAIQVLPQCVITIFCLILLNYDHI